MNQETVIVKRSCKESGNFFNQSWNFTNFTPEFDQICPFLTDIKKLVQYQIRKSAFSFLFRNIFRVQYLSREMVVVNREKVMEKS